MSGTHDPAPRAVFLTHRRVRRLELWQMLQHGTAAVTLLVAGLAGLRGEGRDAIVSVLDVVASGGLLVVIARELRRLRAERAAERAGGVVAESPHADHEGHHGLGWADIFAGAMLLLESYHHYEETHHVRRPTLLLALLTLALGVLHPRLARLRAERRYLRADDDGIRARLSVRRTTYIPWREVTAVRAEGAAVYVTTADGGERQLDLARMERGAQAAARFAELVRTLRPEEGG